MKGDGGGNGVTRRTGDSPSRQMVFSFSKIDVMNS